MLNIKKYVKFMAATVILIVISVWLYWRAAYHLEFLYPYLSVKSLDLFLGAPNLFDFTVYIYEHIIGFVLTFLIYIALNWSLKFKINHYITRYHKITTATIVSIFIVGILMFLLGSSLACTLFMIGCYILMDIYLAPVRNHRKQPHQI